MAIGVFGLQVAYKLKRLEIMSTTNTHGWFGGGFSTYSTVDRIDFSNDTGTASVRGLLTTTRTDSAATGNSNYGWIGGGSGTFPTTYSTVDRIDFSNDLTNISPRGVLTLRREGLSATSNTTR